MTPLFRTVRSIALASVVLAAGPGAWAAGVQVAVAANFAEPMKAIAAVFEKTTGHHIAMTVGSTGRLAAQIKNGAPFDVLLAANVEAPLQLEKDGLIQANSRFTYAVGKLVLWSADSAKVDAKGEVLKTGTFRKIAYASPKVAPYGQAALEVIEKMGLSAALTPRLVQGESIGQTFHFVHTGNADLGFVALSQVLDGGKLKSGSVWMIPQTLYAPIRQDAVVLARGASNPAAQAFMLLLKSPHIQDLIRSYGYES